MKERSGVSRAFTVVELLVVIVVIGILARIVIVSYATVQASARDKTILSDIDTLDGLEASYGLSNNVAGKVYYSGTPADVTALGFTPSPGNIIDIVINSADYCIRGYNSKSATYKTMALAAKEESSPGVCAVLSPAH